MELPKVYANMIDKNINNNVNFYRSDNKSAVDLYKLRNLFDRNGFVDRVEVDIKGKDGWSSEKLVLMKSDYFININNKKIFFDDIVDYKIKK